MAARHAVAVMKESIVDELLSNERVDLWSDGKPLAYIMAEKTVLYKIQGKLQAG